MRDYFAKTSLLAKFALRRERLRIPIWIVSIVSISMAVACSFPGLYPPGPERGILAKTLENPAIVAMIGPNYGRGDYHLGAVMAHQMLLFTAIAVGIMNILLAVSHTRRDEERGRIEVVRALPVGRLSSAGAALLVLSFANIAIAVSTASLLGLLGLEGLDWPGSCLYGAALGVSGIFFATATVLIAQLTETSRAALGLSFSLLGLSYLLRAIGDVSSEALALISPLGLILRTQAYVNNYWWPVLIMLAVSILFVLLAFRLNMIRDLGAGFITAKPGRKTAPPYLRNPLGLALRLQRTTIIGWAGGLFILGVSYGSVFGEIDAFFESSDILGLLLPGTAGFSLTEQFTTTLLAVMTMIGMIPVLIAILRLKSEEQQNRTEHFLARAVSRLTLMGSYLIVSLSISILAQFVSVLGLWTAGSSVMAEPLDLKWLLKGGFSYLPVVWIMIGAAAVLIGFIPRFANFIWLHLGYTFFVIYLGGLLHLPNWMRKLTPFGYIPDVPLETLGVVRAAILIVMAVILILLGLAGYRRRDVYG